MLTGLSLSISVNLFHLMQNILVRGKMIKRKLSCTDSWDPRQVMCHTPLKKRVSTFERNNRQSLDHLI